MTTIYLKMFQAGILVLATFVAGASQNSGGITSHEDSMAELDKQNQEGIGPPNTIRSDNENQAMVLEFHIDDITKEAFGKAVYSNELWTLNRNQSIYEWQDFSTRLIFWSVLALVFIGVFFAGIQFFQGFRESQRNGSNNNQVSHVEVSAKGIKVSSPFLGVIILVIALAFFYLYLVHVYPISLTK